MLWFLNCDSFWKTNCKILVAFFRKDKVEGKFRFSANTKTQIINWNNNKNIKFSLYIRFSEMTTAAVVMWMLVYILYMLCIITNKEKRCKCHVFESQTKYTFLNKSVCGTLLYQTKILYCLQWLKHILC